mmetsp:Transcript_87158/g.106877  ORF Transcript_87158/g.106877 Transcript_87158/m.106877 type:complete len:122 (-) Transcript_87158:3-368(-)
MEDSGVCNFLYKIKPFFWPRNDSNKTYPQIILSLVSIIIIAVLYFCVYRGRQKLNKKGDVNSANRLFLYVYKNVIKIYIICMMIQFIVSLITVIMEDTELKNWDDKEVLYLDSFVQIIPHL